jgi:hypothetical protein
LQSLTKNRNDIYSNKKNQSPSYCDRILYCAKPHCNIRQVYYTSIEDQFGSDHKPVNSEFILSRNTLADESAILKNLTEIRCGKIELEYIELELKLDQLEGLYNSGRIVGCLSGKLTILFDGNKFIDNYTKSHSNSQPFNLGDTNGNDYWKWSSEELPLLYLLHTKSQFY